MNFANRSEEDFGVSSEIPEFVYADPSPESGGGSDASGSLREETNSLSTKFEEDANATGNC